MATTWPTISEALRFRMMPICPVAQKVQPMAQPTWLERQSVTRSRVSSGSSKPEAGCPCPCCGASGGVGRRPGPPDDIGHVHALDLASITQVEDMLGGAVFGRLALDDGRPGQIHFGFQPGAEGLGEVRELLPPGPALPQQAREELSAPPGGFTEAGQERSQFRTAQARGIRARNPTGFGSREIPRWVTLSPPGS